LRRRGAGDSLALLRVRGADLWPISPRPRAGARRTLSGAPDHRGGAVSLSTARRGGGGRFPGRVPAVALSRQERSGLRSRRREAGRDTGAPRAGGGADFATDRIAFHAPRSGAGAAAPLSALSARTAGVGGAIAGRPGA